MKVIGIGDSHLSHACLFDNGKLVSAIAEERLTRNKAEMGFPINSIKFILKTNKLKAKDIDLIAIAGQKSSPYIRMYKRDTNFSPKDWVEQNYKYYIPKLLYKKNLKPIDDFNYFKNKNKNIHKDPFYKFLKLIKNKKEEFHNKIYIDLYKKILKEKFKFDKDKIFFYRHEDCHKVYGIYSCPKNISRSNVLTIEGGGDDSSATFSIFQKKIGVKEIWRSNEPSLGRLFRNITIFLGMRPGHDEYKVMGLAPYGSRKKSKQILKFFKKFDFVKGVKIKKKKLFKEIYLSAVKNLEGSRFDNIAYALQNFVEEILIKWSKNVMNYSNSKNIILSGGVAQNIKALNAIYNFAKPNYIWSGPVSGDGSLGIGAGILGLKSLSCKKIKIDNFYLGTTINNLDIEKLTKTINKQKFRVEKINFKKIANFIAKGKIVAIAQGKSEFGMRALGNRSILADPRYFSSVNKINFKIKNRDFWMPFTPTFMNDKISKYIVNPKNIYSPYMTMAFNSKKGVNLEAVQHPKDKTMRPQMLKRKNNLTIYKILHEFYKITKVPCILNTSFNLHGEPLVENVSQAFNTFKKTGLDMLILNETLFIKK